MTVSIYSSTERALIYALALVHSVEQVARLFPYYDDRIYALAESIRTKADIPSNTELEARVETASLLIRAANNAVLDQDFDRVGDLRERVRAIRGVGPVIWEGLSLHYHFEDFVLARLKVALDGDFLDATADDHSRLVLLVEPGTANPRQIGEFLSAISDLYSLVGGSGITFRPTEIKTPELAT